MTTTHPGCIALDHPAIPGHFPDHPIVPGVVLLTELLHAVKRALGPTVRVVNIASAKFTAPLHPGEPFMIQLAVQDDHQVKFSVTRDEALIASGFLQVDGSE
jgi:3-hydroxymyristoyl/3-hydroxydecanoyl-(acyl carrier protein) dehydratase